MADFGYNNWMNFQIFGYIATLLSIATYRMRALESNIGDRDSRTSSV